MMATSQPLATRAGLRMLERGGNAADAVLAAAAVLSVTEPMSTGIGGDAFAIVWDDGDPSGLDAAGPAPAVADELEPVERGPRSVTVPGAVHGWAALSARHGRLGLDACLADAIDAAERGFAVGHRTALAWGTDSGQTSTSWAASEVPPELAPPPRAGQRVRQLELAETLRGIAERGPEAFYEGPVAEAICRASWLEERDLASYASGWVRPLRVRYRDHEVLELPPPTQGVAAAEALALLDRTSPDLPSQIGCARLALQDARERVRDGAEVSELLEPAYLERRLRDLPAPVAEPAGGTVYLCAVDGERMAVSFIQSLYGGFGSGIVAPGTGVVLQNRGACFAVGGSVEPGRRPYHTIIPGLLLREGRLRGPFGVMGGYIQAQAHMQLVSAIVDDGLDPQAALDRPRFLIDRDVVRLEEGLWACADELERVGVATVREEDSFAFGGGQAILTEGEALFGGSDPRKDGYAAGY
jgi:gamma-glutamyltranspeptidase / glutathione hydrolase